MYPSTYVGQTSCYAGPGSKNPSQFGIAFADSVPILVFPKSASDYLHASLISDAVSGDYGIYNVYYEQPLATSSGAINLKLDTAGPIRSGYLELVINQFGTSDAGNAYDVTGFMIGSFGAGCSGNLYPCAANFATNSNPLQTSYMLPFQLGQQFLFSLTAQLSSPSNIIDGGSIAYAWDDIQFRFVEADGVTPVAILPEPSTACSTVLALMGMFTAAGIARRRLT